MGPTTASPRPHHRHSTEPDLGESPGQNGCAARDSNPEPADRAPLLQQSTAELGDLLVVEGVNNHAVSRVLTVPEGVTSTFVWHEPGGSAGQKVVNAAVDSAMGPCPRH